MFRKLLIVFVAILMIFSFVRCDSAKQNNNITANISPETEQSVDSTVVNVYKDKLEAQKPIEDDGKEVKYSVSGTISSDMVVQRNNYFNVFGWSENVGGIIYAEFMGEKRYGIVNKDGEWKIQFSPHEATKEAQILKIYPQNGVVTEFKDILVGDVWIVNGQSNAVVSMSLCLAKDTEYRKEIDKNDPIRIYTQSREYVMDIKNKVDFSVPQKDTANEKWKWKKTTTANVNDFSALGYYFAKELGKQIDVPLGIIMTAAGGATLQELMPAGLSAECETLFAPSIGAGGFYNALIHPFTQNPITGMIFYQGESESAGGHHKTYCDDLVATFKEYRNIWKLKFPIINVQLSTHGTEGIKVWNEIHYIRAAQFDVTKKLNNVFIIVSRDQGVQAGDGDFAHPPYKRQLGVRAAGVAASEIYNVADANYVRSPEPENITWNQDNVLIDFVYVGDGLKLLERKTLKGFTVIDKDGKDIAYTAEILDEDTVKITVTGQPTIVQYAMIPNANIRMANLGNSEGLPVPGFEIAK